jgi:heme exporter protein CcmB
LADILALILKDLKIETRARYALGAALAFGLCVVAMTGFALGGIIPGARMRATLLWITVLFASMQMLSHLFTREEEEGTILLLRSRFSPDDIFIAKCVCMFLLILPVAIFTLALFAFFMSLPIVYPLTFFSLFLSGCVAIACATAFSASIAARSRAKGTLFAVLSAPALIPPLVILVSESAVLLSGGDAGYDGVLFCFAYGAFVAAVSLFLFRLTWNE